MAGRTESGPDAADAGLFRGASWALIETARTDEVARRTVERFVGLMGAKPLWLGGEAHDRAVAASSHLPALAAVALVRSLVERRAKDPQAPLLMGPGFRDASRLAAGHPVVTAEMLVENANEIELALETYSEQVTRLRALLRDRRAMVECLEAVRTERSELIDPSIRERGL